jgi:hypothetical protein
MEVSGLTQALTTLPSGKETPISIDIRSRWVAEDMLNVK